MNNLKYRIWNSDNKVFFNIDLANIFFGIENLSKSLGKHSPCLFSRFVCSDPVKYNPDFIYKSHRVDLVWQKALEYKDSQGTEIYEGDIVSYSKWICEVKSSIICNVSDDSWWELRQICSNIKIIGNIFETPELLKNKTN